MARGLLIHPRLIPTLRRWSESGMPERCQIFHRTRTSNGAGGTTGGYPVTPDETVDCRRGALGATPKEQAIAAKLTGVTAYVVSVPVTTDIRGSDRLVIGSDTLEVVGFTTESWEADQRVVCIEVAGT